MKAKMLKADRSLRAKPRSPGQPTVLRRATEPALNFGVRLRFAPGRAGTMRFSSSTCSPGASWPGT